MFNGAPSNVQGKRNQEPVQRLEKKLFKVHLVMLYDMDANGKQGTMQRLGKKLCSHHKHSTVSCSKQFTENCSGMAPVSFRIFRNGALDLTPPPLLFRHGFEAKITPPKKPFRT